MKKTSVWNQWDQLSQLQARQAPGFVWVVALFCPAAVAFGNINIMTLFLLGFAIPWSVQQFMPVQGASALNHEFERTRAIDRSRLWSVKWCCLMCLPAAASATILIWSLDRNWIRGLLSAGMYFLIAANLIMLGLWGIMRFTRGPLRSGQVAAVSFSIPVLFGLAVAGVLLANKLGMVLPMKALVEWMIDKRPLWALDLNETVSVCVVGGLLLWALVRSVYRQFLEVEVF